MEPLQAKAEARRNAMRALDGFLAEHGARLEDAARLACELSESPVGMITLVSDRDARVVAANGFDCGLYQFEDLFCCLAVDEVASPDQVFLVDDLDGVERFARLSVTKAPHLIRSYAGVPILFGNNPPLGMLAVMDRVGRQHPAKVVERLKQLGRLVSQILAEAQRHASDSKVQVAVRKPDNTADELLLYKSIFNHSNEAIGVIDARGVFLLQNAKHRHLLGFQDAELEGKTPAVHLGEKVFGEIGQALAETGRFEGHVESTLPDGRRLVVELTAFSVHREDGSLLCHVGMKHDVTEKRQTEKALAEYVERFELAVSGSRDGLWDARVFSFDPDSPRNRIYATARCRELLGQEAEEVELPVTSVFAIIHPEDRPRVIKSIRGHLLGRRVFDTDLRMRTRDGGWKWFNFRASSSRAEGNWPIRFAGSMRDITHQKRLEERLLESKEELESSVRERTKDLLSANFELVREVNERKRAESVQRVLYQISEAAANTSSLAALCSSIHASINTIIDATNFYISLYNAEDGSATFPYVADPYDDDKPLSAEEFEKSFSAIVVKSGEPLLLNGARMEEMTVKGEVGVVGQPCRAWLGVPLRTRDKIIGVVVVQSYTDEALFDESDVAVMSFVSAQVANVIERHRAAAELQRKEQQLELHFRQTPLAVIMTGLDGMVLDWNPSAERMFGYSREEALAQELSQLVIAPELRSDWLKAWGGLTSQQSGGKVRFRHRCKDGQSIYCEWYNNALISEDDQVVAFASLVQDITDRVRAEEALRTSEERYALAVRGANDGIWDWNLKTNEVYYSPRWKEMLGLVDVEVGTSPAEWLNRIHAQDRPLTEEAIAAHLDGRTSHFQSEHRVKHSDGNYRWVLARGLAVREEGQRPTRLAGSQTDITERKQAQEQVLHAATHDPLTGLPNRALFMDRLRQAIHRLRRRQEYRFALLFIDLDRFKLINDSLGHLVGDRLLQGISERLQDILRPQDTLARFGGDEFTLLLDDVISVEDGKRVADRLLECFAAPFPISGNDVYISASIGIVMSPPVAVEPEDLLRDADMAMYQAKGHGKAAHLVFDTSMREKAVETLRMETEIRLGVERGEFFLVYQPLVDAASGKVTGFEALLRWRHPEHGVIGPSRFLKVAEESGLIEKLGEVTIPQGLRDLVSWLAASPKGESLQLGINLSRNQLLMSDLVADLAEELKKARLQAANVAIEVCELTLTDSVADIHGVLDRLNRMGFKMVLDDFGTGFSSLKHLDKSIFSAIKLHPSFYLSGAQADDGTGVLDAVITLAEKLGIEVVAEGIESEVELWKARTLRCRTVQGYHFGKGLSAEEAMELVKGGLTIAMP